MSYILLVEDNLQNAELVIHILTTEGYTIKHFVRGLEAARHARQERPQLILMDFNLPDIDGRTLVLSLKKQLGDSKAPPIVALTARTGDTEMYLAQKFGCSAFISKPFTPERLLEVVKQMIP